MHRMYMVCLVYWSMYELIQTYTCIRTNTNYTGKPLVNTSSQ